MKRLRGPDGCPWDREQTLQSLQPFILEEAYEVVEAIETNDVPELCGELGDLLFEVVFVAQLCAEAGQFTVADAAQHVVDKLIRRHPHVFGPKKASASNVDTSAKVVTQWDAIKALERRAAGKRDPGPLGQLPLALPALTRALHISRRAAKSGFDWPTTAAVVEKLHEETRELEEALERGNSRAVEEELGDLLFVVANVARKAALDPEAALRRANTKFVRRFTAMARDLAAHGQSLEAASSDDMEASWVRVKAREHSAARRRPTKRH